MHIEGQALARHGSEVATRSGALLGRLPQTPPSRALCNWRHSNSDVSLGDAEQCQCPWPVPGECDRPDLESR